MIFLRHIFVFAALIFSLEAFCVDSREIAECILEKNIKLNREDILQSEANLSASKSGYLPSVALSGNAIQAQTDTVKESYNSSSITVEQKILDLSLSSEVDAKNASLQASQSAFRDQVLKNATELISDLANLEKILNRRKLLENEKNSYENLMKQVSAGTKIGMSDSNDLLQAKSKLLGNEITLKQLDYEIYRQRQLFLSSHGFPAPSLKEIVMNKEISVSVEKLPGVRLLKAKLEEIEYQKKQEGRSPLPKLNLQGSYTVAPSGLVTTGGSTRQYSVGLMMDLSGLWKNAGQKNAYGAIAEQRKNQIRQSILEYKNKYAQIEQELALISEQKNLMRERLQTSMKGREIARAKARLGRMSFLEFQQIESSIYEASEEDSQSQVRETELYLEKELTQYFSSEAIKNNTLCRLRTGTAQSP